MAKPKRKKKAYEYKSAKAANSAGYSTKQYKDSLRGKKAWDNKSTLEKELTLSRLKRASKFARRQKMYSKEVVAYEIVSQSHYDARGKTPKGKKYHTLFEYNTRGIFENEPNLDTIEKMVRNSLISAFNNGRSRGGYLKQNAFNKIVENNLRGIKVQPVKVTAGDVSNRLDAQLDITNQTTKYKWTGTN